MNQSASPIYTRPVDRDRVTRAGRLIAAIVALACLGILAVAVAIRPAPSGTGTHARLGFQRCQFLERTGLPCPSCGMTTSYAWFVRGNLAASFYVQPMGTFLALLTTVAAWTSLYIAFTARPAHRLVRLVPTRYYVLPLPLLAVAAWGWKMILVLKGIDGWP